MKVGVKRSAVTRTEVPQKTACDEDVLFVMKGRDAQTKQLTVTEQGVEEARGGAGKLEACA